MFGRKKRRKIAAEVSSRIINGPPMGGYTEKTLRLSQEEIMWAYRKFEESWRLEQEKQEAIRRALGAKR